jgi:HSP20 family protein
MSDSKELEKKKASDVRVKTEEQERFIRPRTSIHEYDDSVVIFMDLPGVSKENLEINYNRGDLSVIGRRETWDLEKFKPCYSERFDGSYRRIFSLDETLDPEKIDAKLNSGVLEITIPKVESVKPRNIKIKSM